MKHIRRLLALLLSLSLLCLPVLAEGFHAGLTVDRETDGKIIVTVEDSDVLAQKKPTLTIPCDFTYAKVTCPDGSIEYCTIKNGGAAFSVTMGGDYVIEAIDELPKDPAPSLPDSGAPIAPGKQEPSRPWVNPYPDVKASDWYYDAVEYATSSGLMQGMGEAGFRPQATMTRAMMWTMLARLYGSAAEGSGAWYEAARNWAMANGVSDGADPNGSITREQLVAMLWRYLGSPAASHAVLKQFSDCGSVSSWAEDAMAWATAEGVLGGKGNGRLDPGGLATRAEVAQIFMNYFG